MSDESTFEFDPYSLQVQENPYPYYAVLRRDFPVYWCEKANCWALSRYEDIANACNDAKRFSSARGNVLDDDPARMGNTLGTSDGARRAFLSRRPIGQSDVADLPRGMVCADPTIHGFARQGRPDALAGLPQPEFYACASSCPVTGPTRAST